MLRKGTTRMATLIVVLLLAHCSFAQTIFRDDFNRAQLGAAWDTPPEGAWSIADGKARNRVSGFVSGILRTTDAFPQTAFVLETQASPFEIAYFRSYEIIFGSPNAGRGFGYVVRYDAYAGRRLVLSRADGDDYSPAVLSDSILMLDERKSYTFRIERYQSGLIKVFLNDGSGYGTGPVLQAVDKTYPTLGAFGWWVRTETAPQDFFVDWIEARYLDDPAVGLLTNVQASSGKTYPVGRLATDSLVYADRAYTVNNAGPLLDGAAFIRTANADKKRTDAGYLSFDLTAEAYLYVLYDPRATRLPAWLSGWTKLPGQVTTTDSGTQFLDIYARAYRPGRVTLGGNLAAPAKGALTNFLVAASRAPEAFVLEAEKGALRGPLPATNHAGYSGTGFADYLRPKGDSVTWQVYAPVPGTYRLSFRYALQSGSRTMGLQINEATPDTAVAFPATGAWSTWGLSSVTAILNAGFNAVTLYATGASGPNLDYLLVQPELVTPPGGRKLADGTGRPEVSAAPLTSYPNPTTGRTTIRYRLTEAAPVSLALFDARGQRVATLLDNAQRTAGVHEHVFDARQVQSGLYFCRLRAGGSEQVIKVIVNR